MKKYIAILIFAIYSTGSAGTNINYHYCCGNLVKISLVNFGEAKGCSCNSKGMRTNCCKDELKYNSNESHRFTQAVEIEVPTWFAEIPPILSTGNRQLIFNAKKDRFKSLNSSRCLSHPLFLLFSALKI